MAASARGSSSLTLEHLSFQEHSRVAFTVLCLSLANIQASECVFDRATAPGFRRLVIPARDRRCEAVFRVPEAPVLPADRQVDRNPENGKF